MNVIYLFGRAVAQAVSRWFPIAVVRVRVHAKHVGFVVDKGALGQVLSKNFGFPCQSFFHQFLHHPDHPGWHNMPTDGCSALVDPIELHPPLHQFKKRI
jgi:hypothetical protein